MSQVIFPTKLSRMFYEKVRKAFPNEEYAILLGKALANGDLEVQRLYFPTERLNGLNPDYVNVRPGWFDTASEIGIDRNMEVLGDIHSHCYYKSIEGTPGVDPSENDWDWSHAMKHVTDGKYRIMGIVRALKIDDKISCTARFWPSVDLPTIKR